MGDLSPLACMHACGCEVHPPPDEREPRSSPDLQARRSTGRSTSPAAPGCFLLACLVTQEADLAAIRAAVDQHNAPFDPALWKRVVKDGKGRVVTTIAGADQVR